VPLKRRGPLVERISFGIVRVYLDDIQEIFSILKEVAGDVRIQADDFVATEPQDLLDISSKTIDELTIVATQQNVTVTLSGQTATIEVTDADTMTLGAVKRIEELMRRRRRRLKRFVFGEPFLGLMAAITAMITALIGLGAAIDTVTSSSQRTSGPPVSWQWLIGLGWVLAVVSVLAVTMGARRQAIVIPRPQKDAPPFWERNRDEIAINAFFTVIGAVLGIVSTLLVQSLGR
jgi:hypothetical protein